MVKYGKSKELICLKFSTVYNICLVGILLVFFLMSYLVGSIICAKEEPYPNLLIELDDEREKETGFYISDRKSEIENDVYFDIELSDEKQKYIFDLCRYYEVPPEIVFCIMEAESSYIDSAVTENGDWGVMQINSINHAELRDKLGVSNFLDFKQNSLCGVYLLSNYYKKYRDIDMIAMCYRYGEKAAGEMWKQGITSTEYSNSIAEKMSKLKYR